MTFAEARRLLERGGYPEVLAHGQEGETLARRQGDAAQALEWLMLRVQACRYLGRSAEALDLAARAVQEAPGARDPSLVSRARLVRAQARQGSRDYDGALDDLREALETLPPGASDLDRAEVLLETAQTTLEAGLRSEAEPALAKGSALVHLLREPRLLAWSLYLRSHFETTSPADLQLSAAYQIAAAADCPELQWQILWRLSERAAEQGRQKMQEDCLWNAMEVLTRLAAPLSPEDATSFWRQGARRGFLDAARRTFGAQFLERLMQDGPRTADHATQIIRDLGFNAASIPDFGRRDPPPQAP